MIREFKKEDTETVIDVWRKASELAHPFLSTQFLDEQTQQMRDVYLVYAQTWVVEVDKKVVGFIAMTDNAIGGLFLAPDFHGQGLGRALVDKALHEKGALTVEVFKDNQIGRKFYTSYGFTGDEEFLHELTGQMVLKQTFTPK